MEIFLSISSSSWKGMFPKGLKKSPSRIVISTVQMPPGSSPSSPSSRLPNASTSSVCFSTRNENSTPREIRGDLEGWGWRFHFTSGGGVAWALRSGVFRSPLGRTAALHHDQFHSSVQTPDHCTSDHLLQADDWLGFVKNPLRSWLNWPFVGI